MTYVTLSIGGSIINPGKIDVHFLQEFRDLVKDFIEESKGKKKLIIVCGGGVTAREYIKASPPDLPPGQKDYLGIAPTWVNAQLLSAWLHEYCAPIPSQDFRKFLDHVQLFPVAIAGGFLPALKTDEDSAIAADYFGSPYLINVTNVDGVYDKDPNKEKNAKRYDYLTYSDYYKMFGGRTVAPGASSPMAEVAVTIAERSQMRIFVIGKEIESIKNAINGKCSGTEIGPEK
ncbi:MAG: Uridylate kinase [Candidatus Heimdallarchaeota archaeon LC_3]|nr:MAG: Uridylate kinase [Candidatus Heimdallarchaeota archaeon LC_3]